MVERFFERGEGNPLFTEELLAAGADGRGRLPSTLRDALLLRVERLSDSARGILRLLSLARRLEHPILAAVSELGEDELAPALREAVEAQLIVVGRDERYGFRHALIREVIYDDLLPGERAELHLRLARNLESTLGEEDHMAIRAAAVAHHFYEAGDQPEALRTAVAAARSVERGGTPGAAAALYDRALALWPRVAEPETLAGLEHVALLARAARAHGLNADEAHAITLYDQALAEVDEAEEPHFFAGLLAEIASVRWAMGQAEKARDNLDRALDLLPESDATPERAMILELKARFLLLQGRFAESRDAADEALRAAEAAGVEGTEAMVLNRLGLCLFFLGEEERGDEVMRKSVELARRSGSNDQLATTFVNYADALHFAGRSEEAAAIAAQGSREVTPGDRSALWIACARSAIAFDLGRWDEAEELLPPRNAAQSGADPDQPGAAAGDPAARPRRHRRGAQDGRTRARTLPRLGRAPVHRPGRRAGGRTGAARGPHRGGARGGGASDRPARVLQRRRGADGDDLGGGGAGRDGGGRAGAGPRRREPSWRPRWRGPS